MNKGSEEFRKNLTQKLVANFKSFEFILSFNQENSFYTIDEIPIKNDGSSNLFFEFALKMAYPGNYIRLLGKDGAYFRPRADKISDFVVYYPDLMWEVNNEKKIVAETLCYKATATREINNPQGWFLHRVEAWFSPTIPLYYDPLNYGGLHGVIFGIG